MRVDGGLIPRRVADAPVALTIGSFDGVHRGHDALLGELATAARHRGAETAVLTFEPHPRCVLNPPTCPESLSTPPEKIALLEARRIGRLVVLPFTREVSLWSAEHFCDLLRDSLDLRVLVVGHDFALGHGRQGDVSFLRGYFEPRGIEVRQVGVAVADGEPVSSTRIRRLIAGGDLQAAAELLGHLYCADATDGGGQQKSDGSAGPAYMELTVPAAKCMPGTGVYASWAFLGGSWRRGIAGIGVQRQSPGDAHRVQVRLIDDGGPEAGGPVRLAFAAHLDSDVDSAGAFSAREVAAAEVEDRAHAVLEKVGPPA